MTSEKPQSANMPRLRFPEFAGDWKDARFDYWFKINAGGDVPEDGTSRKKSSEFPFPVFANSAQNRGLYGYARSYREEGDCVTVSGRGELGIPNARHEPFLPIVRLLVLRPWHPSDMDFFENAIRRTRIFVESTGVPQLTGPQLSSYRIAAPSLAEQKKIAAFLGVVDARIAALRAKVSRLESYKRGLMQALFSQTLRFTKQDGTAFPDWEERKLGHVFSERSERGNEGAELLSVTLSRGVVRASDIDREDGASADRSNYKTVYIGDIAYNSMRMWQGANGVSKYVGIVSPAYTVITPRRDQIPLFWGYYFKLATTVHKFERNSQGLTSDTWNLKFPALSSIRMMVPHADEQQKIVDTLSAMDAKIQAVSGQVALMETFKKGLLQQMFV